MSRAWLTNERVDQSEASKAYFVLPIPFVLKNNEEKPTISEANLTVSYQKTVFWRGNEENATNSKEKLIDS